MRLLSWNINGIRASYRKGLVEWIESEAPDVICFQETKARRKDVPEGLLSMDDYFAYYTSPKRKGYSGVAVYSVREPVEVQEGLGEQRFDEEGRLLKIEYPEFTLFNVYFPNGKASSERLRYKMDFYDAFLELLKGYGPQRTVVCGDVNTAHTEKDLARPKENSKVSGFLPQEREWIDTLLRSGFVDTYRYLRPDSEEYTWWDLKIRARERNVGWRIDYFFVTQDLIPNLRKAEIFDQVQGSDHCPIAIEMEI